MINLFIPIVILSQIYIKHWKLCRKYSENLYRTYCTTSFFGTEEVFRLGDSTLHKIASHLLPEYRNCIQRIYPPESLEYVSFNESMSCRLW